MKEAEYVTDFTIRQGEPAERVVDPDKARGMANAVKYIMAMKMDFELGVFGYDLLYDYEMLKHCDKGVELCENLADLVATMTATRYDRKNQNQSNNS